MTVWGKSEHSDFQWDEVANKYRRLEGHVLRSNWRTFKKTALTYY